MQLLIYDCAIGLIVFELADEVHKNLLCSVSFLSWTLDSLRLIEVVEFNDSNNGSSEVHGRDSCVEHVTNLISKQKTLPRSLKRWFKKRITSEGDKRIESVFTMHKSWADAVMDKYRIPCSVPSTIFSLFRFIRSNLGKILDEKYLVSFDQVKTFEMERFTREQIKTRYQMSVQRLIRGHRLLENLKEQLLNATDVEIEEAKQYHDQLQKFISDRVQLLVPNLVEMVGIDVAMKFIAKAGSLQSLANYTSSDIQVAGHEKFLALRRHDTLPNSNINLPSVGLLGEAPIFKNIPNEHHMRFARSFASKVILAIRVDLLSNDIEEIPTGIGTKFRQKFEKKFSKFDETNARDVNTDVIVNGINYFQPKAAEKVRRLNQETVSHKKKRLN